MTRQRRSHLIILALVPVVVFAAVRCADSSAPLPLVQPSATATGAATRARIAKLHEETDWIGQFHNDALAYVYASTSRLPEKARGKRGVCETARRAYAEFHRARRGQAVPQSVDAEMAQFCAAGSVPASRATVIQAPHVQARKAISPAAESLMDQLAAALDASTSYPDLSNRVNSIEAVAASTLSEEDAAGVFIVGSVTLSSATYWANNVTNWVPLTNTPDYSILLSRGRDGNGVRPPALNDGFDWGDFANRVWNDTKRAAKRAGGGDVRAVAKVVVGTALAEGPWIMDVILASAAAGSIMAVLQI